MSIIGYEVSELTEPISETAATGVDVRDDVSPASHYYTYKDIRNEARSSERKSLIDDNRVSLCEKQWRPILNEIPKIFINETKDLELCAWYIEALCRTYGFKGFIFGFKVATELIEKYWDDLYPLPEDELSERVGALVGLNGIDAEGALIVPLKTIPITDGGDIYTFSDYEQACEVDRLGDDAKKAKIGLGFTSMEEMDKSVKESPEHFLTELNSDIEEAIAVFKTFSDVMDEAMLGDAQPTSYIEGILQSYLSAVHHLGKDIFAKIKQENERAEYAEEHSGDDAESGELVSTGGNSDGNGGGNGPVNNRVTALEKLNEIAVFFRNTEPHSPMSYGIEQIVHWASLTLPELLNELIVDDEARMTYFKLSGINLGEDGEGEDLEDNQL